MSWLRRNLAALLVIVVTLPVLAFVLVGVPLLDKRPADITVVPQGDTAEAGGYGFTLTISKEFVGTGDNGIPVGSSIVGALIDVTSTGGGDASTCGVELTSREGGTDRAWSTVSSPRDFEYGVSEDSETTCILEDAPFQYEAVFLTPTGAYEGAAIDLSVGSTVLRMQLQEG